tara:strand:- start:989 stop:1258 length:270 start_codon:yes stop_codon:yes gene_type:complete
MKEISKGFLRKDTKAYKPDKKTGKWRGVTTKNGAFATINPGWNGELKIDGKPYKIEVWAFNTRWGVQSLFYKIIENTTEEEDHDRSSEF